LEVFVNVDKMSPEEALAKYGAAVQINDRHGPEHMETCARALRTKRYS
jgi:hypothetical protein